MLKLKSWSEAYLIIFKLPPIDVVLRCLWFKPNLIISNRIFSQLPVSKPSVSIYICSLLVTSALYLFLLICIYKHTETGPKITAAGVEAFRLPILLGGRFRISRWFSTFQSLSEKSMVLSNWLSTTRYFWTTIRLADRVPSRVLLPSTTKVLRHPIML